MFKTRPNLFIAFLALLNGATAFAAPSVGQVKLPTCTCGVKYAVVNIKCEDLVGKGGYTYRNKWSFDDANATGSMNGYGLFCDLKNPGSVRRTPFEGVSLSSLPSACPASLPDLTSAVERKLDACVNAARAVCERLSTKPIKVEGAYGDDTKKIWYLTDIKCN